MCPLVIPLFCSSLSFLLPQATIYLLSIIIDLLCFLEFYIDGVIQCIFFICLASFYEHNDLKMVHRVVCIHHSFHFIKELYGIL